MSISIGTKVSINLHEIEKRFDKPCNFWWYMATLGRSDSGLLGGGYHVVTGTSVVHNVKTNEKYTVYKLDNHKFMFRESELALWQSRDMFGNLRKDE